MLSALFSEIPYWGQSLLRVLGGLVAVLLPAGTVVYLFLFKMMSFMQSRLGPMEAGPYGSMQLFAEVGKWLQKEDIVPANAQPEARIFKMAPLHHHFELIGWSEPKVIARFLIMAIGSADEMQVWALYARDLSTDLDLARLLAHVEQAIGAEALDGPGQAAQEGGRERATGTARHRASPATARAYTAR